MRAKKIISSALITLLLCGSCLSVHAEQDTSSYGYLTGQQESSSRRALFDGASGLTSDEAREAYFAANGIGGGEYTDTQHLDAEELLEAGVIEQETADRITAYVSGKVSSIQGRYVADIGSMSPEERNAYYESFRKDGSAGDTVAELLGAGVIT
ncbi:MAG: hypothetical protein SOZ59_15905 [Candidatus Limivivens sp.]|nr:hypothetical protein [Candidatus Limivivens sp.]